MRSSKLLTLAAWLVATPLILTEVGCQTTKSQAPVYLVKIEKGDTLASIAAKYDTTWDRIASLNGFKDGSAVKVGRVIRVQPGPGGIVAGAEAVSASAPTKPPRSRLSKGDASDAAGADEFTEEDLPEASGKGKAKRKGLLFGGGETGASLSWPVRGELSSLFGMRHGRPHEGIDIRAKRGTEISAAGDGVVEFAGRKNGYGKTVVIRHGDQYRTLYAHMSAIQVERGERVGKDTVVGNVGTTGNASGPHLHFEIHVDEEGRQKAIDPLSVLEKDELLSSNAH